jgi:hypothetical protein
MTDFEKFLKDNCAKGAIDLAIRANDDNGKITFYIHAINFDSETLDFSVNGNKLIPLM